LVKKSTVATLSGLKRLSVKLLKDGIPFSILSKQMKDIRRDYLLPPDLLDECVGFTHLIAIYRSGRAYKRERLLYYHMESEQALDLTIGLINRLQSTNIMRPNQSTNESFLTSILNLEGTRIASWHTSSYSNQFTKNNVTSFKD